MSFDLLDSPLAFFQSVLGPYAPLDPGIVDYAAWWASEADARAHRDAGPDSAGMLARGFAAGIVRRVQVQESLLPSFALLYITAFHDPWIATIYADSLVTRHIVDKYAPDDVRASLLARLEATENPAQGSFWLPALDTRFTARATTDGWRLTDDGSSAYGAADFTLVVAYPEGVETEALFLAPKLRDDGSPNTGQGGALSDSHAYLMATPAESAALRMEIETLTQAFGAITRLGASQRNFADGEPTPERVESLQTALALAWSAAQAGDDTAREVAGLYSDSYQRFRLLAHLAELQSLEIVWAATSVISGPTEGDVEGAPAKLPSEVLSMGPPLLAELGEYTDADAPSTRREDVKAWAQVLAQAFAHKFKAAARLG